MATYRVGSEHNSQAKSKHRPEKCGVIMTLSEEKLLVSANKKAAYAIHRGHITRRRFAKTRRRFIAGVTS